MNESLDSSDVRLDRDLVDPTDLDRTLAVPMFLISLTFLGVLAAALHMHEERPELSRGCLLAMGYLWPLFILEGLAHYAAGSNALRQHFLFALIPPLRIVGRDHRTGRAIWLPRIGWQVANADLREEVERAFSLPLIIVAIIILPLFGLQMVWGEWISRTPTLRFVLDAGNACVWMAFALEFIVMISIVRQRFQYCREHWIDLVILLLPLIAFLRALRIGRLLKLKQFTKAYRLRGVLLKAYRTFMVLDVVDQFLRGSPEKRLAGLERQLEERATEISDLKDEIERLKAEIKAEADAADALADNPGVDADGQDIHDQDLESSVASVEIDKKG